MAGACDTGRLASTVHGRQAPRRDPPNGGGGGSGGDCRPARSGCEQSYVAQFVRAASQRPWRSMVNVPSAAAAHAATAAPLRRSARGSALPGPCGSALAAWAPSRGCGGARRLPKVADVSTLGLEAAPPAARGGRRVRTSSPHQDAGLQTGYRTSLQHRSREYSAALADARRLGGTARHGVRRTPLFMIAFGGGESKVQYVYRKRTPHNRTKKRSTCRQQLWPGATSGEPATTHQGSARARQLAALLYRKRRGNFGLPFTERSSETETTTTGNGRAALFVL